MSKCLLIKNTGAVKRLGCARLIKIWVKVQRRVPLLKLSTGIVQPRLLLKEAVSADNLLNTMSVTL